MGKKCGKKEGRIHDDESLHTYILHIVWAPALLVWGLELGADT